MYKYVSGKKNPFNFEANNKEGLILSIVIFLTFYFNMLLFAICIFAFLF